MTLEEGFVWFFLFILFAYMGTGVYLVADAIASIGYDRK